MYVTVNGRIERLSEETTVRSYLESKGINPNVVACELNLKILRRAELASVRLKDGDELEIIRMVGGG